MWVLRNITAPRAIGCGLALASTGLLIIACTDRGTPAAPSAAHSHGVTVDLGDELDQVRRATAPFQFLDAAVKAGYELGYVNGSGMRIISGCVAHPTAGAMGYHYFNKALIDDLVVDPLKPEGLVYVSGFDGRLQLAAVEYVVPGLASNPPGVSKAPTVFGADMVILVPAVGFYTLHAWVWRYNPAGTLAHWNPDVVCP